MSRRKMTSLLSTTALAGLLGAFLALAPTEEARAACAPAATGGDDTITCTGTTTGDLDTLAGNDTVDNSGTIDGNVSLGDGDDALTLTGFDVGDVDILGSVDGGAGTDMVTAIVDGGFNSNSDISDFSQFSNFESFEKTGAGAMSATGFGVFASIRVSGGRLVVEASDLTGSMVVIDGAEVVFADSMVSDVQGGFLDDRLALFGGNLSGTVALGDGNDTLEIHWGNLTGTFDGGAGTGDRLAFFIDGGESVTFDLGSATNFEIFDIEGRGPISSAGTLVLTGTGSFLTPNLIRGNVELQGADLTIDVLRVGTASNSASLRLDATSVITARTATAIEVISSSRLTLTNMGTIFGDVLFSTRDDMVTNMGIITGDVRLGSGADLITNSGTLNGNIDLGAGDDIFTISGGILNGNLTLGTGTNTLRFDLDAGSTLASVTGAIDASGSAADTIEFFGVGNHAITLSDLAGIEFYAITLPDPDATITVDDAGAALSQTLLIESQGRQNSNIQINADIDVGTNPAGAVMLRGNLENVSVLLFGDIVGTVGFDISASATDAFLALESTGSITTDGVPGVSLGESLSLLKFSSFPGSTINVNNSVGILASSGSCSGSNNCGGLLRLIDNEGDIVVTGTSGNHGIHITGPNVKVINDASPAFAATITVTSDLAHGIFIQSGGANVDNEGLIETFTLTAAGVADGIRTDGGSTVLFGNIVQNSVGGVIRTHGDGSAGIRYLGIAGSNDIDNDGLIETLGAGSDGVAIQLSAFAQLEFNDPNFPSFARFRNRGTIRVTGVGSVGVRFEIPAGESGRIDNQGLIDSAGVAILGGDGNIKVVNESDIVGSIDLGLGDNELINSGTITGNILFRGGADIFTNSGDVFALVSFNSAGGTFDHTGTVQGSVDIQAGTLTGNGQITGNVVSSGTVAPSSADSAVSTFGTMLIGGNYTQSATGTLEIEILGVADNDLLAVGGIASLDGTLAIEFNFTQAEILPGDTFEFLTAAAGVTGTFATVTANTRQFLDATVIYTANSVSVRLDRSSFLLPFFDSGRRAIAAQLDAMAALSVQGTAGQFIQVLTFTERSVSGNMIDQLVTEAAAELSTPTLEARHGFLSQVSARTVELTGLEGGEGRWVSTVSGYGEFGDGDNARFKTGGAMAISAYGVSDRLTVGFALAGSTSDLNIASQFGDNEHTALDVALFAGYRSGGLFVSAAAGASYDAFRTERAVLAGAFQGQAQGETTGSGYSGAIDVRYRMDFGNFLLTPRVAVRLAGFHHGAYDETGLGNLGLRIDGRTITSVRASAGATLSRSFGDSEGFSLTPELGASWERELGDRTRSATASFIANPLNSFTINGTPADGARLRLTGGLTARFNRTFHFSLRYEGALGQAYDTHRVIGGLRLNW